MRTLVRRALALLTLILAFTLFAATPASAVASRQAENRASGLSSELTSRVGDEARLSEDAIRENIFPTYDLASDDAVAGKALTKEQAANLGRFKKSVPWGAGPTTVRDLPGGGKAFQAEVPGKVPGLRAVYEKLIDASGRTTQFTKTTYDPAGNIVHAKDKITGVQLP